MKAVEPVADPRTVVGLVSYLERAAKRKRDQAEEDVSHYGAGLDSGMALAFEMTANWLREALEFDRA